MIFSYEIALESWGRPDYGFMNCYVSNRHILLFVFISNYYYFPHHLHIPQVSEVSGLEIGSLAPSPTEYVGDLELRKANKYVIS